MKIIVAGVYCKKSRIDESVRDRRIGVLYDDIKSVI